MITQYSLTTSIRLDYTSVSYTNKMIPQSQIEQWPHVTISRITINNDIT